MAKNFTGTFPHIIYPYIKTGIKQKRNNLYVVSVIRFKLYILMQRNELDEILNFILYIFLIIIKEFQ